MDEIAGITGFASGSTGALGDYFSAQQAAREAEKNRGFQERMSSTSHQREVEDLRKAGLNPILSARLGGSSTPPGAMAPVPDYGRTAQNAVNSAMSAIQMQSNMALNAAQTRDVNAAAHLKEVQGRVSTRTEIAQIETVLEALYKLRMEGDLTAHMKVKVEEEIGNIRQTLKLLKLDESHSALDLARARQESDFYKSFGGKVAPWLDHILGKLKVPGRR